jgi:hypothetical protein
MSGPPCVPEVEKASPGVVGRIACEKRICDFRCVIETAHPPAGGRTVLRCPYRVYDAVSFRIIKGAEE